MRTIFFILGLVFILAVASIVMFVPDALVWFAHHPVLDGFLALIAIVFHWFNTYAQKQPFVPKV